MPDSQASSSAETLILIGTHGHHIHGLLFDPVKRTLRRGESFETSQDPSWLTRHPSLDDIIYANGHVQGKVFALRKTNNSGGLEALSEATTGGGGPTHIAVHQKAGVILAHVRFISAPRLSDCEELADKPKYKTGNVTTVPLTSSGSLGSTKHGSNFAAPQISFAHPRQEAPHAHQIVLAPNGDVFLPDLGSNKVWRLRWDGSEFKPVPGESLEGFVEGDGPRHMVLHPDGKHAYTINELSSSVTVHSLDSPSKPLSKHNILPPGDVEKDNRRVMTASEIVLLPAPEKGGRLLMITSNRDSPNAEGDALALFSVDAEDGSDVRSAPNQFILGAGKHLRGVAPDKSGKWVCVTGRNGGGVVIYERTGSDGLGLSEVARLEGLENPVCPLWLD